MVFCNFTYELKAGTKAENYDIQKTEGTLTVTGDILEPEKTTPEVNNPYKLGDQIPFTITVKNV